MKEDKRPGTAYWLENGEIITGTPEEYFPFLQETGHVISIVGGGGKSTTLHYLAGCFADRGRKTVAMTTTKMGCPADYCKSMAECRTAWQKGRYAVCGQRLPNGKLDVPSADFLSEILKESDAVVIEADGARGLPCKAPAAHEPVILPQTDIVIAVMGLDALGKPVDAICHRSEIVQDLLGCNGNHRLTTDDLATILLSPNGSKKGVEARAFYTLLNKCDDAQRLAQGKQLLKTFHARGQNHALLTCGMKRSEHFEYEK